MICSYVVFTYNGPTIGDASWLKDKRLGQLTGSIHILPAQRGSVTQRLSYCPHVGPVIGKLFAVSVLYLIVFIEAIGITTGRGASFCLSSGSR